jgi:hypothetical protein
LNSPEIILIDLLIRSFKKIKFILALSVGVSIFTYVFCVLMPQEFSYKGLLRIAQIVRKTSSGYGYNLEPKLLVQPIEIETFLKFKFNKNSSLNEGRASYLRSIGVSKSPGPSIPTPPMLEMITRGPTLESARNELENVLSALKSTFSTVLETHKQSNLKRMELIKKELESTRQDRTLLLDPKSPIFRDSFTTFFMTGQFFGRQSTLELSQVEFEEIMDKSQSFDFSYFDIHPLSKSPVFPAKKNAAIVSFFLCMLLTFTIVFLREFTIIHRDSRNPKI